MAFDPRAVEPSRYENEEGFGVTGVIAGSYTNTNLTVNSLGLITAASNGASTSPILAHAFLAANAGHLTVPHTTTVPFPTITNTGFTIGSPGQVTVPADGYLQVNMMVVNASLGPLYNYFGLALVGAGTPIVKTSEVAFSDADPFFRYYHLNTIIPVTAGQVYEIRAYSAPDSVADVTVNGFASPTFSQYDSNVTWTLFRS